MDLESAIADGIAEILWTLEWANHAEEAECTYLSGCDLCEIAPEAPPAVREYAYRVIGRIEGASDCGGLLALYWATLRAAGIDPDPVNTQTHAARFGNCLAYMTHGHGASWFDDHATFEPLERATYLGLESCDLQYLAAGACEACKANPMAELDAELGETVAALEKSIKKVARLP